VVKVRFDSTTGPALTVGLDWPERPTLNEVAVLGSADNLVRLAKDSASRTSMVK
jgi:hypothetical protein